ncbi:MAG: Bug family tripartite tricarboxylate transporter substrate binding protein [Lautropia sp.]
MYERPAKSATPARRRFVRTAVAAGVATLGALAGASVGAPAHAADAWPDRPIRLIVPYPPGGPVDQLGRAIAPALGEKLGQSVVIENKSGAGGSIGLDATIRATPDGYTFGFGVPGAIAVLPHLQKVPYDPAKIEYLTTVARVPQVIVASPGFAGKDLKDLIAIAKKSPGKLNYASAGKATTTHLGAELLSQEAGIQMVHVPYKGATPAVTALLGNEIDLFAADFPAVRAFLPKGIKVLAVSGSKRIASLPDVPTTAEMGLPGVSVEGNYGIVAATGTPEPIKRKMYDALRAVLAMPEIRARIEGLGASPEPSTPEEYRALMESESKKWGAVIGKAGITLN